MTLASQIAALLAVLSTGVVYGTDVFCAIAQRPALAQVDDSALTAVMGNLHRFADRRMPLPGVLGVLASAAAAVLAAVAGRATAAAAAGAAFLLLVVWLVIYLRISAPINRRLTAAADAHETPADARELQRRWDRVIVPRATLQGLAVLALAVSLIG
jgi:anthrone oxygenase-like protein